jgi:hypothetical protein
MISRSSLALAESIAVAHNSDTPIRVKNLVVGLNEQSYGSAAYTPAGFRDEIVRVTGEITPHSQVMDATSDRLAAVIRGGFDMIKDFGVPFAKSLAAELGLLYTSDRLQDLSFSRMTYNFVNVDDPFFESQIYPTEVKNSALDFSNISLEALNRLQFNYASSEEIKEYVNTSHPDVVEILSNDEYDLSRAANSVTDIYELQNIFSVKNSVFNFGVIKSLEINRLLKMYVVLTKMVTDENPVKWLSGGKLSDYREYVNLLWNGMTRYLISLKQIATAYKSRVVAIGELEPIRLADHPNKDYEGAKFMSGNVQIFYTAQSLALLEEHGISFKEWLVAVTFARFNKVDVNPASALTTPDFVKEWAGAYYKSIDTSLSSKAKQLFIKAARERALKFLLETPKLNDRVGSLVNGKFMVDQWFSVKMGDEYEKAYYAVSRALAARRGDNSGEMLAVEGEHDGVVLQALMAGGLVPAFLRAVECNLAADIVEATYVSVETQEDTAAKRQRLHAALIKLIVKHSIGA